MSAFKKSSHSNKGGACEYLAGQIAAAATAMGLEAWQDRSRISASHYVSVRDPAVEDDEIESLKIRVSDHDDRHGGSDWYVWTDECPSAAIGRLAAHFGRDIPAGYRRQDYMARSERAKLAAGARRDERAAAEAAMTAAVSDALRGEKTTGHVVAGRIVDRLYPAIPRAQRMRIAQKASRIVTLERALAAAGTDEMALIRLAADHYQLRAKIAAMIGTERFIQLRPAGQPRAEWRQAAEGVAS